MILANQSITQFPKYSPLSEQWEQFVQFLTRQDVRQATVKTSDDRLAVIWSEIAENCRCADEQLKENIINIL